jgi:hypothetical protein
MTTMTIRPEDQRDPYDSHDTLFRIEIVAHCDGVVCDTAVSDRHGQPASCMMHDHLVISGYNPLASPRYFAIRL